MIKMKGVRSKAKAREEKSEDKGKNQTNGRDERRRSKAKARDERAI